MGDSDGTTNVQINNMYDYYIGMLALSADAAQAAQEFAQIATSADEGLNRPLPEGRYETLFEAQQLYRWTMQQYSDFASFVNDVNKGVRNMGSAAGVIAEAFGSVDYQNSSDVSLVQWAFAAGGAAPPDGFRETTTWSEHLRQEQADTPMSQLDPEGGAPVPLGGHLTMYRYPDGSYRIVSVTRGPDGHPVREETVYGRHGDVLRRITESSSGYYGYQYETETTVEGSDPNGPADVIQMVTAPDGTKTINTWTVVDGVRSDIKTEVIEVGARPAVSSQNPMEQVVEDSGSDGSGIVDTVEMPPDFSTNGD